jgi:hypothetical protein
MGTEIGLRTGTYFHRFNSSFFLRCGLLSGSGLALSFVFPISGFFWQLNRLLWGIGSSFFSHPMDFNKRRGSATIAHLGKQADVLSPFLIFLKNLITPG